MKRLALVLLVVASNATAGSLYRCNSPDGTRTYTTKPMEGAECTLISYRLDAPTQPAAAPDSRWSYVDATAESALYLRTDSIVRKGNRAGAWVMFNYNRPQGFGATSYRSTVSRWNVDCAEKTMTILQSSNYELESGRGTSISSRSYIEQAPNYVVPDSLGDVALSRICALSAPKAARNK